MSGTLQLGYDYATDVVKALSVDTNGKLHVDMTGADGVASETTLVAVKAAIEVGQVAGNNTRGNIGDGATLPAAICLGYDNDNGKMVSIDVDAAGRLNANIIAGVITLPVGASTEAKQDVLETSLTSMEGKLDTIDGVLDNSLTKQTEIDAVLDTIKVDTAAIKTSVELLDNAVSGNELQVDIVSGTITLPSGAATEAKQDVLETSLTSMEGKLDTIDGVLDSSLTKQTEIDAVLDTINGKVTACNTGAVVLGAGSAAFGKLSANSGVDIGDVDVISCALPTGAATAAKQDVLETSLTSMEGKLDTIDAVLDNSLTKQTEIDAVLDTINGKVTACNTGAVVLGAGSAAFGKLSANSGVDIGDVDVISCALPTGAATAAKQDVLETSLTSMEGKLDTIDAVLDNSLTKQTEIDAVLDTINGKVTACNTGAVVLGAGSAAFGKLSANSGVDIGDVDVLSLPDKATASAVVLFAASTTVADSASSTSNVITKDGAYRLSFGLAVSANGGSGWAVVVEASADNTNWYENSSPFSLTNPATNKLFDADTTMKYVRVKMTNNTGGSKDIELSHANYTNGI